MCSKSLQHTQSQKVLPLFPELRAFAIASKLRSQNGLNVLLIRRENNAFPHHDGLHRPLRARGRRSSDRGEDMPPKLMVAVTEHVPYGTVNKSKIPWCPCAVAGSAGSKAGELGFTGYSRDEGLQAED